MLNINVVLKTHYTLLLRVVGFFVFWKINLISSFASGNEPPKKLNCIIKVSGNLGDGKLSSIFSDTVGIYKYKKKTIFELPYYTTIFEYNKNKNNDTIITHMRSYYHFLKKDATGKFFKIENNSVSTISSDSLVKIIGFIKGIKPIEINNYKLLQKSENYEIYSIISKPSYSFPDTLKVKYIEGINTSEIPISKTLETDKRKVTQLVAIMNPELDSKKNVLRAGMQLEFNFVETKILKSKKGELSKCIKQVEEFSRSNKSN